MKTYDNLNDLPIWHFYQVLEHTDTRYLLILDDYNKLPNINAKKQAELAFLWAEFDTEYLTYFGIDDKFKDRLLLEKTILLLSIDYALNKSAISKSRLMQKKQMLERISGNKKSIKLTEILVNIEKFLGFQLDPKTLSVIKFYSYIQMMEKQQEHGKEDSK